MRPGAVSTQPVQPACRSPDPEPGFRTDTCHLTGGSAIRHLFYPCASTSVAAGSGRSLRIAWGSMDSGLPSLDCLDSIYRIRFTCLQRPQNQYLRSSQMRKPCPSLPDVCKSDTLYLQTVHQKYGALCQLPCSPRRYSYALPSSFRAMESGCNLLRFGRCRCLRAYRNGNRYHRSAGSFCCRFHTDKLSFQSTP